MRRLLLAFAAALPITAAAAQGIEDFVSESVLTCDRFHQLPLTVISRDAGRPWLAVTWIDGNLVTMENTGTMEAPVYEQVVFDDELGRYDWRAVSDEASELGWTAPGEGGARQVVLTCNTSGEGGY